VLRALACGESESVGERDLLGVAANAGEPCCVEQIRLGCE
jgi:hypothetical protein